MVLASEPRSVTACGGAHGARVLRLHGYAFREVLNTHPAMTSEVIRLLARRLHSRIGREGPLSPPLEPCSAKVTLDSH